MLGGGIYTLKTGLHPSQPSTPSINRMECRPMTLHHVTLQGLGETQVQGWEVVTWVFGQWKSPTSSLQSGKVS